MLRFSVRGWVSAGLAVFGVAGCNLIVGIGELQPNDGPADGGPDADGGPVDGGADQLISNTDGGKQACSDITGSLALAISAVSGPNGIPKSAQDKGSPLISAGVRVETLDGKGCLDGVTDASGKITISVDSAKGPFNVTVAKAGFGIASIMGVKGASDVTKLVWVPQPLVKKSYNISGAITGLKAPTNKVQVHSAWFATVFSTANVRNYQTQHFWVDTDKSPVQLAGIEIDANNNNAVQGELMPPITRTQGPMSADLTFDYQAITPTTSNLSITLAGTGQFTGPQVNYVGDLTSAKVAWTNTTVARSVALTAVYVGIATLGMPVSNVSNLKVQWFNDPSLKPDYASAFFTDQAGNSLTFNVTNFTNNATFTLPPITKLDVGATASTLADTKFTADATGADLLVGTLSDSTTNDIVWVFYFPGLTVMGASLPHLPASVNFSDVSGAAKVNVSIAARKTTNGPDWSNGVSGTISTWSYVKEALVATTGR